MLNVRFILKILGWICLLETMFILTATGVAFYYGGDDIIPLSISAAVMFACGLLLSFLGRKADERTTGRREGMLTVTLIWILLSLIGMLPFYLGGYLPNISDAFFETMSGFTTTGSSTFRDVEALPKGILFWRSLTQWQGGIGMIVFTVALLPIFGFGAMQLFDAETTGITHDRFRPRVTQVAKRLWGIYFAFTIALFLMLWAGPMDSFDALNHAFTTLSTGGYSTKNTSLAHWDSAYIDYTVSFFMFIGATNFSLHYYLFKGNMRKVFRDEEFRWFVGIVLVATGITTAWIFFNQYADGLSLSLRQAIFQVMTLTSTTGFATADFIPWGPFFWYVAISLMLICGCAGSTCGGMKISRFVVLSKTLTSEFRKRTHPHAIIPIRMNGHAISSDIVQRVLAFAVAYMGIIIFASMLLSFDGMGFEEALGSALTAVSNVGPGFGTVGPSGNFADVPSFSKWVLSFVMLVGRLELFTVLTILAPSFWQK